MRFYMNMRYRDRLYADEEGDDLPDEGAVKQHAIATARDMILLTRTDTIRDWFDCIFEITDESGERVLVVPFGAVVSEAANEGGQHVA